jgi:hypothetical protein
MLFLYWGDLTLASIYIILFNAAFYSKLSFISPLTLLIVSFQIYFEGFGLAQVFVIVFVTWEGDTAYLIPIAWYKGLYVFAYSSNIIPT